MHIDTRELESTIDRIVEFAQKDAISLASIEAHAFIKAQTAGGLGVTGRPLKAYTPKYKKFKEKKKGSADPVNMRLNNEMINSPTLEGNEFGFFDDKQNAKALGNLKHRPTFFGASQLLAKRIAIALSKHIGRL